MNIQIKKLFALLLALGAISTLALIQAEDESETPVTESISDTAEASHEAALVDSSAQAPSPESSSPESSTIDTSTSEAAHEEPAITPEEHVTTPAEEPTVLPEAKPEEQTPTSPAEPTALPEVKTEESITPSTEKPVTLPEIKPEETVKAPEPTITQATPVMTPTPAPTQQGVTQIPQAPVEPSVTQNSGTPAPQQNKLEITAQPAIAQPKTTQIVQPVVQPVQVIQPVVQPVVVTAAEQELYNRFAGKSIDQVLADTNAETQNLKAFSASLSLMLQDPTNASIIPLDFLNLLKTIPAGANTAILEQEQKSVEATTTKICLATYNNADKCKQLINADRQQAIGHTQFLLDMITLTKTFKAQDYAANKAIYDNAEQALKNNIAAIEKLG